MFTLTPTKYALELSSTRLMLKVYDPRTQHGYAVIEAVPFANGVGPKPATLASMRKHGAKMAKRWNVPFEDRTEELSDRNPKSPNYRPLFPRSAK